MNPRAAAIVERLRQVTAERKRRQAVPGLALAVAAVKRFQQRRFSHTYGDLLNSERYGAASRFFLEELYGPRDFSQRDAQFARVVPTLVRLFPIEVVETVQALANLHAVSEMLDTKMGQHIAGGKLDALAYIRAWQATGLRAERERQIALTLEVGSALEGYTRHPLLRHSLRMMRGPAKVAGLGELQRLLESGFDTFRDMGGAKIFLETVGSREHELASALFDCDPCAQAAGSPCAPEFNSKVFALLPRDVPS